jgi:hypothetical protein
MKRDFGLKARAADFISALGGLLMSVDVFASHYMVDDGTDSNVGTSKTPERPHEPWLPGSTDSSAYRTPTKTDSVVLRGGGPWHFGHSAVAYLGPGCGGGVISWSASSGNSIYWDVEEPLSSGLSSTRLIARLFQGILR